MKKIYLLLSCLYLASISYSQTTYLPSGTPEYHLLDRLETMDGVLSDEFSTTLKPLSRKDATRYFAAQRDAVRFPKAAVKTMSYIDFANIERALSISGEWTETAEGDDGAVDSRRPILKYFYQKQADMVHVHTDDFFLVVNPVLYLQAITENGSDGLAYINTRGVEVRGKITDRLGFYTLLGDNQEKLVSYASALEAQRQSYPGFEYYSKRSGVYDALLARGYFDFSLAQEHVNVTFGYDKNFVGDGMRSLFLSESGAPATFLRLRSRFWKLHYENLFLELMPDYQRGADKILSKKYAAMHQLSINALPWLNVGIFESTIAAKANHFSPGILVPVIFYQTAARALGAQQKTSLGINFKAIALHRLQLYGQAYFDRLNLSEAGSGSWQNQWGAQLGVKYFDVAGISNLDIQAEGNLVRPFSYASADTVSNYTHYNQPLAHPYGAGFAEGVFLVKYQPLHNLYIAAKAIYSIRGVDTGNLYLGNSIFSATGLRSGDDGYGLVNGEKITGFYANLNIAYEWKPNIFLEAGATHLSRTAAESNVALPSSTFIYGGLRLNISRREYDYF